MTITFGDPLELDLHCAEGEAPRLTALRLAGRTLAREGEDAEVRAILPLSHVELAGHGRAGISAKRHVGGAVSARLRYLGHRVVEAGEGSGEGLEAETGADGAGARVLEITSVDPVTGLTLVACLEQYPGVAAVRSWTRVTAGSEEIVLLHVTSLLVPGVLPVAQGRWEDELTGWAAANPWCGEGRWSGASLAAHGLSATDRPDARNRFARASTGSWSSGEHLPMGALADARTGRALAWQIEHNGSWAWEVGDSYDAVYLGLSGPCDAENQWSKKLAPGESFTTVPVTLAAAADGGLEAAAGELTRHRRRTRRAHADHRRLPIIFNDYMNCLSGDPSTERLLPLVEAAARAGAEYFVVDAGWYDDTDGWWESVGEWQPSTVRFPGGFAKVMARVRERGMVPGLWLEPEVVGLGSPIARSLPAEAFFSRHGRRHAERGRYQLDLRHPAARAHLDATVDRLIADFGLGYLKFDYNIEIGPGTDHDADSAGDGLLGHNRAYTAWLADVLDRHPGLVIESCASGGMRTDHAMLAVAQLHSTTDQTDFRLIPPIAASVPLAVAPEQAAIWAYPVPEMTDEETAFTLAGALLGRVHLSGRLDLLRPSQQALVAEALEVYRGVRPRLPASLPHWPLGLPAWRDGWVALALDTADGGGYLLAWRRDDDRASVELPLPWLAEGARPAPQVAFPHTLGGADASWNEQTGALAVTLARPWTAVLIRLG
jgi:alpha-galactosidase